MVAPALLLGGAQLVSGLFGASSANKAAKAQERSANNAFSLQQQQMQANAPWQARGNQAGDYLQELMGLGSNDSYESLANQYADQFTTYKKNKKKGGGLGGAIKGAIKGTVTGNFDQFGSSAGSVLGAIAGAKSNKKYTANVDTVGLDAFVKQKMAEQKAKRESGHFGSLLKNFDNSMFEKDPGYDFRMQEGNKGIQGSLAAQGGLFSGKAGKALTRYNQDFASNEFNQAANRYNQNRQFTYNSLSGIAGTGQNAQQFGSGIASNMGNVGMEGANARAAGYMGQANALSGALSGGLNYWQQQQALNKPQTVVGWGGGSTTNYIG